MRQTEWAPSSAAIAGCGLAGVILAISCAIVVTDIPGRLLTGIAAVGLMVFAGVSWYARPRLAIASEGLLVRGWRRRRLLRRPDIRLIRITEFRRVGRKVRLLEVDTFDDRLLIFSRWDLGADPLEVLDELTAHGYADRS